MGIIKWLDRKASAYVSRALTEALNHPEPDPYCDHGPFDSCPCTITKTTKAVHTLPTVNAWPRAEAADHPKQLDDPLRKLGSPNILIQFDRPITQAEADSIRKAFDTRFF